MADLTVKQKQIFDNYKKTHPKMSDAEILSALVNLGQIQLSEDQKASLFFNSGNNNSKMGLQLEHSANPTNNQVETVFLQSGRKIVITKTQDGKDLYKYYAADGTQLKPDYFKKQEGVVRVSANKKTYTVTKNGNTTVKEAKDPLMAKIDQQQAGLNKTKKEQGFIGKSWDWFKNKTGIGDGSDKAQKQLDAERKLVQQIQNGKINKNDFKNVTGLEYSKENLQKFKNGEIELKSTEKVKGYQEGQDMACDVAGDMISGIAAVGIYTAAVAAAPFTGGASIAVGVAAATASGALIKAGVKALDTVGTDRKYTLKDFGHDTATGAFSGALAPITGGLGGAVGKTVATKLGIQAVKQVGKEVAEEVVEQGVKQGVKQGLKTALTNPTGYEYVGGTLVKRGTAMAAEMATDGALGGAIDGGFRAGLDNDWDANAILSGTVEGGIGGALMAPIIGGGFKAVGKGGHKLGEKIRGGKEASEAVESAIEKEIAEGAKTEVKTIVTKEASLTEGKQLAESAKKILSTLKSARELVDKDGNKVIIFHRNWLNAGDWSYLRFDKEGKQIGNIETIAESDFEKVFGEGNNINKSSKLNKSGTLMMSLDFGILESLARTLKVNYDLYKFNKNYSAQRSDLTWKSFDEIVKLGKSKSKITKDSSLESFQKNVQNLEEQIRKRYSGKVDQSRRNAVIERAEKIREDYYMKEYGHTSGKLPYLSDVQIIYLENVLRNNYYSEANRDNILIAVNNVVEVKSPLSAYVVETLLPHTSKWREYNLYPSEIVPQIDNVEQALVLSKVLQNPPSELYSFSTKYVFECKTPSQLYLCNKALDLSSEYNCCYDYINLIKNVKTKEEYEIVKNILSEKEYAEKQSWYLRDIIKVANKNQELQQLFLKFTSIPEALKNDSILTFIRNNFGENYPKTEYLPLLNYVFSNKKLYKNKNIVENLSVYAWQANTPEKTQKLIYILEYIASHKELSDTRKKVQVVTEALRFTKTKDEIDPKIKVLDFCLSNEKIKKTNFLENAELLLSEIKTNKEADETIKLMLKIMSDTENGDIVEYLPLLVSFPKEYNKDLDSLIYMTDKIISDNNFKTYKEQGVDVNALLGHTLVNAPTTKDKNVMDAYMQTVKIFLTKKSLAENPNLLDSLNGDNKKQIIDLIKNGNRYSIPDNKLPAIIGSIDHYDYHDYQSILKTYGYGKISTFSDEEFKAVLLLNGLYRKSNINEIPMYEKKKILRNMVHLNSQLFSLSSDVLKDYPLMPKSAEEYCDILPAMVRSLGIQTNYIKSEEISKFNSSLSQLSQVMSGISDKTFADLTIKQDYPKDKFIKDVLAKVKDLSRSERQKVYDYFGFELHHNPNNETGFSITGYPVNLNNGKKLAQISDPNTRAIIEALRPDVIKFSTRNRIRSNNPQVEQFLNDIVEVLPEIRTAIGKNQHKTQKFDIMQHSLKVFKKLSQDSNFKKLNDSDKKIMLLASLLHDITKGEGFTDNTHAYDSSFDAYYIAKKLRLTEDESSKLYTLIKHHEWLEFVNTARRKDGSVDNELLKKRLQSVAYDLQYDNLFDMALMFTHADLRSVKIDDSFHDSTVGGKGRTSASGKPRSYGDIAEDCAKAIRSYIKELKASQPLLPHTTMPKSSKIARAITKVHSDGSTNLRGVYVDPKDKLIIIKFNEATDKTWEALGMPKGTSSQTAKAKVKTKHSENEVDVGNINFIVHGLDYENQLVNFDSFALKDSEALLSVSYTERPRDKYRFFRTQGVTLKTQTKYIHGGGARDSGSGYKKTIADFKNRFLFGGEREDERLFLSQLIKEATGMSDKEYIEFVEKNANKSMYEIEPAKIRDKIIKAYASINSNVRRGDRSYNECYVSNAEASAPFVYPEKGSVVGNPVEFLNSDKVASKTEFLRKYAHDNDEVFIVFGD